MVAMPNCAPLADISTISTAPRFAEMNARPVIQAGSDRPDRKKSRLSDTRRPAPDHAGAVRPGVHRRVDAGVELRRGDLEVVAQRGVPGDQHRSDGARVPG